MILLDTHVLIWWVAERKRIPEKVLASIEDEAPALASPISFWEMAVLVRHGKISVDRPLQHWARDLIATRAVEVADLTPSAAISAAELPDFHGDPADRIIYATARALGIPLVSKDRLIRNYASRRRDVSVIWQ